MYTNKLGKNQTHYEENTKKTGKIPKQHEEKGNIQVKEKKEKKNT
jgi:hypothetical protein